MNSPLSTHREGRVVTATLSRPPVNALDDALIARLLALVDEVEADADAVVLHLRSDQKCFCAGADLAAMRAAFASPEGQGAMLETVKRMQRLFLRLENAAVVTLAEIGGAAMGGGLELALACDLRVAAAEAPLGLPEARLGLLPAAGGTQRLTRLCGEGTAKRLILGAEIIDGVEALRLGIVQWAQPAAQLQAWTREFALRVGAMPKAALIASKRCIAAAVDPRRSGFAEEIDATRELYGRAETKQRVAEFLGRRDARSGATEAR